MILDKFSHVAAKARRRRDDRYLDGNGVDGLPAVEDRRMSGVAAALAMFWAFVAGACFIAGLCYAIPMVFDLLWSANQPEIADVLAVREDTHDAADCTMASWGGDRPRCP